LPRHLSAKLGADFRHLGAKLGTYFRHVSARKRQAWHLFFTNKSQRTAPSTGTVILSASEGMDLVSGTTADTVRGRSYPEWGLRFSACMWVFSISNWQIKQITNDCDLGARCSRKSCKTKRGRQRSEMLYVTAGEQMSQQSQSIKSKCVHTDWRMETRCSVWRLSRMRGRSLAMA
jgi:hypothetical protein